MISEPPNQLKCIQETYNKHFCANLLTEWIARFNELGFMATEHVLILPPNNLIDVRVPGNKKAFTNFILGHKYNGAVNIFALNANGTFHLSYSYGENDQLFLCWYEKLKEVRTAGWIELANSLMRLKLAYQIK